MKIKNPERKIGEVLCVRREKEQGETEKWHQIFKTPRAKEESGSGCMTMQLSCMTSHSLLKGNRKLQCRINSTCFREKWGEEELKREFLQEPQPWTLGTRALALCEPSGGKCPKGRERTQLWFWESLKHVENYNKEAKTHDLKIKQEHKRKRAWEREWSQSVNHPYACLLETLLF